MITGKGMYIWKIRWCEGGDAERIAQAAVDAGYQHVLIKIANGTARYNIHPIFFYDLVPPVVKALRVRGISVWGWQYVYGNDPIGEARMAGKRMRDLALDGFVVDAEAEYKQAGRATAAKIYMNELRRELPVDVPVALSTYRYPTVHPEFPWDAFLPRVDLVMPQVYWAKASNSAGQLIRSRTEYQRCTSLPFVPTGAAYHEHGWTARPEEIESFYQTAKTMGLPAFNFWEWGQARTYGLWDTIAGLSTSSSDVVRQRMKSVVYGLRIRKDADAEGAIQGSLLKFEAVTVLELYTLANGEVWCRHERGWSCVQQPPKAPYMELVY